MRATDQQLYHVSHGAEISADIDRICHEQQCDKSLQQPVCIVLANIAGDPRPGGATNATADLLNHRHKRVGEQHRPGDRKPELRPRLRVGGPLGSSSEAPAIRPGPSFLNSLGLLGPTTGFRTSAACSIFSWSRMLLIKRGPTVGSRILRSAEVARCDFLCTVVSLLFNSWCHCAAKVPRQRLH